MGDRAAGTPLGPQGGEEFVFLWWLELLRPSVLQAGGGQLGVLPPWPGPGLGPPPTSPTFLLKVVAKEHEFPAPPGQGLAQPSDNLRQGSWCRSPNGPAEGSLSSYFPSPTHVPFPHTHPTF